MAALIRRTTGRRSRRCRSARRGRAATEVIRPLYHGSAEADIKEFDAELQRSAEGFYFTPDPATAAYYGPNLYTVEVHARKVADFTDERTFFAVAENAMDIDLQRVQWDEYTDRYLVLEDSELQEWAAKLVLEAGRSHPARRWWAQEWTKVRGEYAAGTTQQAALEDWLDYEASDEEDMTEHFTKLGVGAWFKKNLDAEFTLRSPTAAYAFNAHHQGTQDWYMEYQDDMVLAAWAMGYDAIWMTDPSSVGASVSVVVKDSSQIRILGVGRSQ